MDEENINGEPENHLAGFTSDHDVPLFMRDDGSVPQAQPLNQPPINAAPAPLPQEYQNDTPASPPVMDAPNYSPAPDYVDPARTFRQFAPISPPDPVHPRPASSKLWLGFVGVAFSVISLLGYALPLPGVILAAVGLALALLFTRDHKIAKFSAIGFSVLGIILSVITVTGIFNRTPETIAFTSEGDGFSLDRPVDWSVSRSDEGLAGIVQFSSEETRDTGGPRATINIVAVDTYKVENSDLEELQQRFFNSYESSFMKTYGAYTELSNVETKVDGEVTRKIDADVIDGQQKSRVTIAIIYNDDGKKSYVIVNTVDTEYFNDYNNLLKTAISSFNIIE